MKRLFRNARWWRDGKPVELCIEDGRVAHEPFSEAAADEVVDCHGAWIMPAFIDCHCHILPAGLDMKRLDLSQGETRRDVLRLVQSAASEGDGWLLAVQYDQTRFEDGRHLTARELDAVTDGRPTVLRHSSGHAAVANTAALRASGISAATPDPPGGTIVRDERGEPLGPLLENAMDLVYRVVPPPTLTESVEAIHAAAKSMRAMGITCATDMATGSRGLSEEIEAYRRAAESGCAIRLRTFVLWGRIFGKRAEPDFHLEPTPVLRNLGVKLFADGAIGAGTAAMTEEYVNGGTGMLIYEPDDLRERVRVAHEAGYVVAIHSIGDRSTDAVLDAFENTGDAARHRVEHVMLLRDDQVERIRGRGIRVTLQPEFLLRFGHAYFRQLGNQRASVLKRARSLLNAGIRVGLSSDRPIVPGDPWDGIRAAVSRPPGFDPSEAVSVEEAIDLYTIGAASVNDETELGSLAPGEWADFQLYDRDPKSMEAKPTLTYLAGETP
jgi:predicted amidohydrolase YtcJ